MPVSIPERTVDAWVAAYLAIRIPDVCLWAPTQRQTPDYDIASTLLEAGKLFVLEDKAPYTNAATHYVSLDVRQMWNYLCAPGLRTRTFYVLPCPPFPVSEVPGAPGAETSTAVDLVPRRAQSRTAPHPWGASDGCELWFRVVPVLDLWMQFVQEPAREPGAPSWPKPDKGPAPLNAPDRDKLWIPCPLPANLGESMKTFVDRVLSCEHSELRVDGDKAVESRHQRSPKADSPFYQALVGFASAGSLPGWDH